MHLRYAMRMFAKHPAVSAIAVLTLALGIGANAAIFTIVNAVLIRPLPYPDPSRLVMLWGNVERQVVERRGASYPDFEDWRRQSRSFESMAAVWDASFTLAGVAEPERIQGEIVSEGYFSLLGIETRLGRQAENSILIGEGLWKRRFGADPAVLGRPLQLDNRTYTVAGVLPAAFRGMTDEAELWMPVPALPDRENLQRRGSRWFPVLARLKPGVTRERAQAEMNTLSRQLERAYPDTNAKRGVEVASLQDETFGPIRPALLVILGAVGFVLLIAVANVANLLLARAEGRQREMAVRMALGAGRARLAAQLIAESMVLSVAAAAAGLLMAVWAARGLLAASPIRFPSFVAAALDANVVAFTVLLTFAIGIALGVAPAFSSRGALAGALRETGRSTRRRAFRSALVVAEVALALVLLAGAGLFIRSFANLVALDPGFRPEGLLSLRVSLSRMDAPDAQAAAAARAVRAKLAALPSVEQVALASDMPLSNEGGAIFYSGEGQPVSDARTMPRAYVHRVTPGFFRTLGIRLVRGRDFTEEERTPVTVVSEGLARRFWPGQDPIGKRIRPGRPDSDAPWIEIVGVVDEVKYRALPRNPTPDPDIYLPFSERARAFAVLVRASVDPGSVAAAVRGAIRDVDSSAVFFRVAPMTERVRDQTSRARFTTVLMGLFAGMAMVLAVIGIYGVMSHSVERRTREIGIRMALGAGRREVLGMVARQAMLLAGAGIAIGACAALVLTRLIRTLLFEVSPADPVVFASVSALLLGAALAGSYVPARRATRVDPLTALHYE